MTTIKTGCFTVEYDDTLELRQRVFDEVLAYFVKHQAFHGEVIRQSDDCIIDSPDVLSVIADKVFKFKVQCD